MKRRRLKDYTNDELRTMSHSEIEAIKYHDKIASIVKWVIIGVIILIAFI